MKQANDHKIFITNNSLLDNKTFDFKNKHSWKKNIAKDFYYNKINKDKENFKNINGNNTNFNKIHYPSNLKNMNATVLDIPSIAEKNTKNYLKPFEKLKDKKLILKENATQDPLLNQSHLTNIGNNKFSFNNDKNKKTNSTNNNNNNNSNSSCNSSNLNNSHFTHLETNREKNLKELNKSPKGGNRNATLETLKSHSNSLLDKLEDEDFLNDDFSSRYLFIHKNHSLLIPNAQNNNKTISNATAKALVDDLEREFMINDTLLNADFINKKIDREFNITSDSDSLTYNMTNIFLSANFSDPLKAKSYSNKTQIIGVNEENNGSTIENSKTISAPNPKSNDQNKVMTVKTTTKNKVLEKQLELGNEGSSPAAKNKIDLNGKVTSELDNNESSNFEIYLLNKKKNKDKDNYFNDIINITNRNINNSILQDEEGETNTLLEDNIGQTDDLSEKFKIYLQDNKDQDKLKNYNDYVSVAGISGFKTNENNNISKNSTRILFENKDNLNSSWVASNNAKTINKIKTSNFNKNNLNSARVNNFLFDSNFLNYAKSKNKYINDIEKLYRKTDIEINGSNSSSTINKNPSNNDGRLGKDNNEKFAGKKNLKPNIKSKNDSQFVNILFSIILIAVLLSGLCGLIFLMVIKTNKK